MNGTPAISSENGLTLKSDHWREMVDHIVRCLPEEACGLVGGKDRHSELVLPVTNRLHSPVRFRMEPQEQFDAFRRLEAQNLDLLAIFHSHPTGPHEPSPTDLAGFAYPDVLSLICFPVGAAWQVRAFLIPTNDVQQARQAREIDLLIV